MESLIVQHAVAARQTMQLARHATPDQLNLQTPCTDWNLRQLLAHMTTENVGFAAAAEGHGAELANWNRDQGRTEPVEDYVAATEALIAAFAEPNVLQRSFALPLLSPEQEIPGQQAVMMHLVDSVVHAWDLARTLDMPLTLDDDITTPVLTMCEQIPDDESRRKPGAAFGPPVSCVAPAPAMDQIVALLGRSPTWPD